MFRSVRIIIKHTVNVWRQKLRDIVKYADDGLAQGFITLDEAQPWRILDGTERPPLFIPIPRAIRSLGDKATTAYVKVTEAYDRYKSQFGDPFQTGEPFAMLSTSDPLTEWTFRERIDVLEQCHLAWERNPDANTAVTYNRLFSVGGGMQRTYRNSTVEEAIEAFCNNPENTFSELEKTLIDTLQIDGELFLRFHGNDTAEDIIMTPLPAWGVQSIKHEKGFLRRIEHYKLSMSQDDGEGQSEAISDEVPAKDIIHVAINRKAYELRGRPELYKVLVWLRAHKEWLENRARQNHYRGSILYDVTLENANAAQVLAKLSQYKKPPAGQAAIAIHNDKETWNKFGDDINASGAKEDGREMRLKVATGMRLPEYMLSDGSMSNLATAKAQALPALMSFMDWQDIARERIFKPVFLKVLERAGMDLDAEVEEQDLETGKNTGDKIKIRDSFEIKYRTLEESDPKNLLEALQIGVANEWISNETAAGLMPFDVDYRHEQEKITAEREREMDEIVKGLRMPPPFTAMQQQNTGDNNNGSEDNEREPEREPAEQANMPALPG